jgi:hypothetical protein
MDIIAPKNSRLLYQRGDRKTGGVIDLSHFSGAKKSFRRLDNEKKLVSDIRNTKKTNNDFQKEDRKETAKNAKKASYDFFENIVQEYKDSRQEKSKNRFKTSNLKRNIGNTFKRPRFSFAMASILIPIIIFSFSFFQNQIEEKGKVLEASTEAYNNFKAAADYASNADFDMTTQSFNSANLNFFEAQQTIDGLGMGIGKMVAGLPIDTPLSTAQALTKTGESLSLAGKDMSGMLKKIAERKGQETLLETAMNLDTEIEGIALNIQLASENIQKVEVKHLPEDMQAKIALTQKTLPLISANFKKFQEDYPLIKEMLGNKKSQRYLLIFQNNSEMRATGGFIGSYGILDIENGQIKNLFIDDIFNPDGQLKEKIVPPMPIQKISSAWSMHDANWFADFPTSAKKIALFYEKTGGSTVDGVISMTPEVIKDLLEITGQIEMPEYKTTITKDNFISQTQNQVESLYNKDENRPKQIISDLTPILIEKLFKSTDQNQLESTIKLIGSTEDAFREKHILIYHRNENIEQMLQKRGWGGEIIQTEGDYLSVVNSNINGYKTDAVIEENISLRTDILTDGSLVNTLTIKRKHLGGDSEYDWYNRVNADYMRVYVPKGSILLEAKGNTTEDYIAPVDYSSFSVDDDVKRIESSIKLDKDSQTQIFEESGKTVFGNWTYVSPKEEVTLVYKYKLPFKVSFQSFTSLADTYKILIQKQSGSLGSHFESSINYPKNWKIVWKTANLSSDSKISNSLISDIRYGIVFTKE